MKKHHFNRFGPRVPSSTPKGEKFTRRVKTSACRLWFITAAFVISCLPVLSSNETWNASAREITVIADDNYPPFIFRDEEGQLTGYLVDEWALWEKKTGIKVILKAVDWGETQSYLQNGKADVIETIFKTTEREKLYEFTPPYMTLEVPVFFHHTLSGIVNAKTLRGFTIGVKAGDACIEILRREGITTFAEYSSYQKVIEAAGRGEIKVFCVDREPAMYLLTKRKLEGDFRIGFVLYTGQFHRAVMKGNTGLLAKVNEGFSRITKRELEVLKLKWLGKELVNPANTRQIWLVVFIIATVAALLGINLLILRYRIRRRTYELRKSNEQLSRSEEKYRALVSNAHESIYVLQDMRIVFVNATGCRSVERSEDELLGHSILDFIPAEDHPFTEQAYYDLVEGRILTNIRERRLITAGGEMRDHLVNSVKIEWEGLPATLNFATDITDLKLADEKLAAERLLLRTVIENIPDAVYVKDRDGRKIIANKADIDYIGLPEDEIIGHTDADLFSPEMAEIFMADDRKVLQDGEPIIDKEEYMTNSREVSRWLLTSKLPLTDLQGKITGMVGIGRDITRQKNYEASLLKQNTDFQSLNEEYMASNEELNRTLNELQKINNELREAKKRAEESDKLKMAFLSNISHEIRTPLNGIIGFAEQLTESGLTANDRIVYSKLIEESGQRLTAVINDIIDISLLQTQQARIDRQPVSLVEVVDNVMTQFRQSARQLNLYFTAELPGADPMMTLTDSKRLAQILSKLVDNALKFTPAGGIRIGLRRDNGNALFYVRDTGIGISTEMQEAIFNPFRQADSNAWKNYGGQGLGLSIVRGFVELMGGRIWLTSYQGEGSTFWISLPLSEYKTQEPPSATVQTTRKSPAESVTILAAEDEMSNYIYLETIISKIPYKLIHAFNGAEAIELLEKNPDVTLVLMDIKMPVMDGLTAFGIIREKYPELPVIALTAFAMADEAARIKEAGFNDYLTKPYRRADLLGVISRWI